MECEECFHYGFLGAIILMASLHGFLLAAILAYGKNLKSKANKYLALSILGIALILGLESLHYFDGYDHIPDFILYLPTYLRTLIPVGFFYFVIYLINPKHQLSQFEKIGFYFIML